MVVHVAELDGHAGPDPGPVADDVECRIVQEEIPLCQNPVRAISGFAVRNAEHVRLQVLADEGEGRVDVGHVDAAGQIEIRHG
ncbi:hypothetical protein GP2_018_00030 [Gordonia paraffinivorans NBRC 108238]|uniref:Uncharacterized protein n=1 Tax=Gordonia paraffinivorans NBRC 108238 TaxID=1223543 RepID=A0ABQ0IKS6_9ACTN|nr:hypothetical protein GP2_018_00030 [Gordonia paraffinivorans NBRC 108238]